MVLLGICLLLRPFLFILLDDGKHAPARGTDSASEECQPSKGNICEAAATHEGLLRYLQPQSNVSRLISTFICALAMALISTLTYAH